MKFNESEKPFKGNSSFYSPRTRTRTKLMFLKYLVLGAGVLGKPSLLGLKVAYYSFDGV